MVSRVKNVSRRENFALPGFEKRVCRDCHRFLSPAFPYPEAGLLFFGFLVKLHRMLAAGV